MFRLTLIKIMGKRERRVPVLLSKDMKTGIDKILAWRHRYVESTNSCIFLPPKGEKPMEGWVALKRVTEQIPDLEHPEAITSTNVRKYIATVSQVGVHYMAFFRAFGDRHEYS